MDINLEYEPHLWNGINQFSPNYIKQNIGKLYVRSLLHGQIPSIYVVHNLGNGLKIDWPQVKPACVVSFEVYTLLFQVFIDTLASGQLGAQFVPEAHQVIISSIPENRHRSRVRIEGPGKSAILAVQICRAEKIELYFVRGYVQDTCKGNAEAHDLPLQTS